MKRTCCVMLALIVLALPVTAQAEAVGEDIVGVIFRESYDQITYKGRLFDIVRTPKKDGTTLVEYKRTASVGITWYKHTTRRFTSGPEKGLVSEWRYDNGEVQHNSIAVGASGHIESIMTIHSLNSQLDVTPFRKKCEFGTENCYRMEKEMSLHTIAFFARNAADGELLGGEISSAWHVEGHLLPFITKQSIRIERLNKTTERLKFIGHNKPWAFPLAGYDLETTPVGKKTLHVCFWFDRQENGVDVCMTSPR